LNFASIVAALLIFSHVLGLYFPKITARVPVPSRFSAGLGQFGGRVRLGKILP
jgi:hypothetical protein